MARLLTDLSFQEWVTHIFDHEPDDPQWYFDVDCDRWNGPASTTVEYITRLFRDPLAFTAPYTESQLSQGLWYLVSNGASDMMFALLDKTVPVDDRLLCIRSFYDLFAKLFAVSCSSHLSHLDEQGASPLNVVCYMWWDLFPVAAGPADVHDQPLNDAILTVMEQTLSLASVACQESGLHGLGHWRGSYPKRVEQIIDTFLASHPGIRPELSAYARSARDCCVL